MAIEVGPPSGSDDNSGRSRNNWSRKEKSLAFSPGEQPHDIQTEKAVLAGILMANDTLSELQETLKEADFFLPSHREIFQAMLKLSFNNTPIDLTTLTGYMREHGSLDKIGGPAYISELANVPSSSAHTIEYAEIVSDLSWRRRILKAAQSCQTLALSPGDTRDLATEVEKAVFDAAQDRQKSQVAKVSSLLDDAIRDFETRAENKGKANPGVLTGLKDIDECLNGFRPGQLVVLAAGPGTGKTSLAANILAHTILHQQRTALFFTLEMTKEEVVERMLSTVAQIDSEKMRRGQLNDNDFQDLYDAAEDLSSCDLYIDDRSVVTPYDVLSQARRTASALNRAGKKLDFIICDYIQIMKGTGRNENRSLEVASITGGLKAVAKDLRVPVLALSQLNRDRAKRTGTDSKLPGLTDLRDSGAIEQDADIVMFIHRDQGPEHDSRAPTEAKIIIAKHRAGATKTIKVTWLGNITKFVDYIDPSYAPIEEYHDAPTNPMEENFALPSLDPQQ